MSESSSGMGFISGLLTGAAVGAAAALVLAPMRGSDMRSKLSEYAPQVTDRVSSLVSSGRCLAEDAINQVSSLIEQGRQALRTSSSSTSTSSSSSSSSEPLTASVADISGVDRRFGEPLGG